MKRFGTVFPFLEQGLHSPRMGRVVANHDFVRALLLYGSFDQYFFSNPSLNNLKVFKQMVDQWGLNEEQQKRIYYLPYANLISSIKQLQFHVFHLGGWGYFMPGLCYLRNRHACNPWPITGVIHSLNGHSVIDQAVRLCHAQMAPYDSIFCTSLDGQQAMRNLLSNASQIAGLSYLGRLDHLPLGISDDLASAAGNRDKMRAALQIPHQAVVLLVLGRITPSHKVDLAPLFIQLAHRIIPNSKSPVYLLIAGGSESDDLLMLRKQLAFFKIENHVRIRANFRLELKPDILAASDILLALSDNHQETFGLSVLEAQGAGLPVIASRFDGFKDLVRDGIDGFLIDTYLSSMDPLAELFDLMDPNINQLFQAQAVAVDMDQLYEKVMLLIENAELRKTMGEIGRNKVHREFLWSRIIRKYENLWNKLTREASNLGLPSANLNPYNFNQYQIFGHYVSRHLLLIDQVKSSHLPIEGVIPYEEILSLINPKTVTLIQALAENQISVQDIIERSELPVEIAWFSITWMIKYNLLQVVS